MLIEFAIGNMASSIMDRLGDSSITGVHSSLTDCLIYPVVLIYRYLAILDEDISSTFICCNRHVTKSYILEIQLTKKY